MMLEQTTWLLLLLLGLVGSASVRTTATRSMEDAEAEELQRLIVKEARVSEARWIALEYLRRNPTLQHQKQLARVFVGAYSQALSSFPRGRDFVTEVQNALTEDMIGRFHHDISKSDNPGCQPVPVPILLETEVFQSDSTGRVVSSLTQWDDCCSILPTIIQSTDEIDSNSLEVVHPVVESKCSVENPCCALSVGSLAYLRLPILQEPVVSVKLNIDGNPRTLSFEQDGYLRPFDPSGVLWPTGYLLTQCIANLQQCGGIEDLFHLAWSDYVHSNVSGPFALELGAGLGVPSITLSLLLKSRRRLQGDTVPPHAMNSTKSLPLVVATDIAPHAVATILTNARLNQATGIIKGRVLNHSNVDDVVVGASRRTTVPDGGGRGYHLVLGSSLQDFFDTPPNDPSSLLIWKGLEVLLDRTNPHALAIFVHGQSALTAPQDGGSFELIRRISGDHFGMQTLWGASSDFEIFVFRRRRGKIISGNGEL